MKKFIYVLVGIWATATLSCSDDDNILPVSISLSSPQLIFHEEGGIKKIIVETNGVEWTYECTAEWLSLVKEGNVLTLNAAPNPEGNVLSTTIPIYAGSGNNVAKAALQILQTGPDNTDLSATGTANCYMAKTETNYRFQATIKGNGKEAGDGNSKYIAQYGLRISDGAYAELLWESTFDADKTRSTKIIQGYPFYCEGSIYFTTGSHEGNAVIALKNNAGEILWSWHIWVSNQEVKLSEANGYSWMDRNLGALNNVPQDINNRGLFYQWGRKDPFLPSCAEYMAVGVDFVLAANIPNNQVGNGSAQWLYSGVKTKRIAEAPGNIEFATQNPTTFLMNYSKEYYDWYIVGSNEDQYKPDLWGKTSEPNYKTIFDPCPVGYMVPPEYTFSPSGEKFLDADWSEVTDNGRYWTGGSGDFFPCVGLLTISTNPLTYCGAIGCYWTAGESFGNSYRLYFNANYIYYESGARVYGAVIRCVKEQ